MAVSGNGTEETIGSSERHEERGPARRPRGRPGRWVRVVPVAMTALASMASLAACASNDSAAPGAADGGGASRGLDAGSDATTSNKATPDGGAGDGSSDGASDAGAEGSPGGGSGRCDACASPDAAAPSDAGPFDAAVPAHFSPTSIACIGDSITHGDGASSNVTGWVSVLAGLFGSSAQVGNFGVSNTTMMKVSNDPYWSTGVLPEAEAYAASVDAGPGAQAAVVIMLGANDSKDTMALDNWNDTAPARYRADYNAMIDALQASTPRPLVFLALPPPAFTNAYGIDGTVIEQQIIPIILDIAAARNLPVVDAHTPLAGLPNDFVDGVHPDDDGHAIIAQTMHDAIVSPRVPPAPDGG